MSGRWCGEWSEVRVERSELQRLWLRVGGRHEVMQVDAGSKVIKTHSDGVWNLSSQICSYTNCWFHASRSSHNTSNDNCQHTPNNNKSDKCECVNL